MTSLAVRVGSLELKNPVLTASGCFGYGVEVEDLCRAADLGGICTKGLSLSPRPGNPPARICETPAGMLNAIGLANIGVDAFCHDRLPLLRERGVTVIANIFGTSVGDFKQIAQKLADHEGIAAIELNVSCPNVSKGGIEFGRDPRLAAEVTKAVRSIWQGPLWVKMSPEAGDIVGVARASEAEGADAITAINTVRGMSIDTSKAAQRIANGTGGLSGPALRPIALRIVWELVGALRIPVIGIGGIGTADDALQFLMAGARAVQIGTACFMDPTAPKRVVDGIREFCRLNEVSVSSLIGSARSSPPC